jgi:hypothetical protein
MNTRTILLNSNADLVQEHAVTIEEAEEVITELRGEVKRLRECAKQQAKGPNGAKTIRVEIIPGEERRFHMVVTFPSSMRAGEVKAANTIASLLGIVFECARSTT